MACRSVMRAVFLTQPWLPLPFLNKKISIFTPLKKISTLNPSCGCKIAVNSRSYDFARNCSSKGNPSSSTDDSEQGPPQEAVLKAISEVSKTEGRVGQTTNVVFGGTVTDDSTNEWLALDKKVNSYPTIRGFTAIGTGGDDFVHAMVVAVESVLQKPVPEATASLSFICFDFDTLTLENFSGISGQVKQKISSGGKYVSVNIGPVQVVSSEQVQAVYNAMRRDDRMKYFL